MSNETVATRTERDRYGRESFHYNVRSIGCSRPALAFASRRPTGEDARRSTEQLGSQTSELRFALGAMGRSQPEARHRSLLLLAASHQLFNFLHPHDPRGA